MLASSNMEIEREREARRYEATKLRSYEAFVLYLTLLWAMRFVRSSVGPLVCVRLGQCTCCGVMAGAGLSLP